MSGLRGHRSVGGHAREPLQRVPRRRRAALVELLARARAHEIPRRRRARGRSRGGGRRDRERYRAVEVVIAIRPPRAARADAARDRRHRRRDRDARVHAVQPVEFTLWQILALPIFAGILGALLVEAIPPLYRFSSRVVALRARARGRVRRIRREARPRDARSHRPARLHRGARAHGRIGR